MATMVKEKRREKKKTKEKPATSKNLELEQPTALCETEEVGDSFSESKIEVCVDNVILDTQQEARESVGSTVEVPKVLQSDTLQKETTQNCTGGTVDKSEISSQVQKVEDSLYESQIEVCIGNVTLETQAEGSIKTEVVQSNSLQAETIQNICTESTVDKTEVSSQGMSIGNLYQDIRSRLARMAIPMLDQNLNLEVAQSKLENPLSYLGVNTEDAEGTVLLSEGVTEGAIPSAPVFEDTTATVHSEPVVTAHQVQTRSRTQCMPIEEAIMMFGGKEMERVKAVSEKEEAIVEAGPVSGPEHPLVDLLTTFRSSLIAVSRERIQLCKGYSDEEKYRSSLWKVEKRSVYLREKCACGADVTLQATYEHAELRTERLPIAKLKLEGLLRDVQDSYCHHQHTALLTHCQIEELISETVKSEKASIREALALVLQALRASDDAPAALSGALERWGAALGGALLDGGGVADVTHLLHHLFRQSRSVWWCARVLRGRLRAGAGAGEGGELLALLDVLLATTRAPLQAARECTEDADADSEETWEEVTARGEGGAVSEGALRERDLLLLLRAFPTRNLIARILLFTHADISQTRSHEWGDRTGGAGVIRTCAGVRALLHTLLRAVSAHPSYTRLRAQLSALTVHALCGLAGLHLHSRDFYATELADKITAELEACWCAGWGVVDGGGGGVSRLPAALLSERAAREYCQELMEGGHEECTTQLSSVPVQLAGATCSARVAMVTQAAIDRAHDHALAQMVLEYLFQTGMSRSATPCKLGCVTSARTQLPRLLTAHTQLHTAAVLMAAECQHALEETLGSLSLGTWRDHAAAVRGVLEHWATRCPNGLPTLLGQLDFTPHTGLSLESQLAIGSWLCSWVSSNTPRAPPEWAWSTLRALRVHSTWWGVSADAPPPSPPPPHDDIFGSAYAVLSTTWGHCIPVICSSGVAALCRVAASRPAEAAHGVCRVMLLMAHSPESLALTPKFSELFSLLLNWGPSLLQRALGVGGESGPDVLLRLILEQIEQPPPGIPKSLIINAWLHGLWRSALQPAAAPVLHILLLACREWPVYDQYVERLLQEEKAASEVVSSAVRAVGAAPLVCACVLRVAHSAREGRTTLGARLRGELSAQRGGVHVNRALQHIGAGIPADQLVIYQCASALLSAPAHLPAHLTLWTFFLHLYLQRPPCQMTDSTPPVGPLFFSGLIKSRTLTQLKRKLQEIITYHHNEAETLKQKNREETPTAPARSKQNKKDSKEDETLPMLRIEDLTGETSGSSESDSDSDTSDDCDNTGQSETTAVEERDDTLLIKYHVAAESACSEWSRWLEEGERTRAMPHHADLARFIPEQVLSAAWSRELSSRRPAPVPSPRPPPPARPAPPPSPFQSAVQHVLSIKDYCNKRFRRHSIRSPLEDMDLRDARALVAALDKQLREIEALVEEWNTSVARLCSLDAALWSLVTQLRVRRPLRAARKQCAHQCSPTTIHIPHEEWCISTSAERGIEENRRSARSLVRQLSRPRPHAARSAAALLTIARRVNSLETAKRAADRVWTCARGVYSCAPAHHALTALVDALSERWLCASIPVCAELVSRWGPRSSSPLQQALCGALVHPGASNWAPLYTALLGAGLPPHITFSYLSRFEISRWNAALQPAQRRELLERLVAAVTRCGPDPPEESHVLLELLGVHTVALLTPDEICAHIARCTQAAVRGYLPPTHWPHVTRAVARDACTVLLDQLGHTLRQLGEAWWAARGGGRSPTLHAHYSAHGTHTGELLRVLTRAFSAAGAALTYHPDRIALIVWSALSEAASPWVAPAAAPPPLLCDEAHTAFLKHLVQTVLLVMADCPGIEEPLLRHVFEWCVQTGVRSACETDERCRVQTTALLEEFRALPWEEHQWWGAECLPTALQVCDCSNKELSSWCSSAWRGISAQTWTRGAPPQDLAPLLASLLRLFTASAPQLQTLETATYLPWSRLPAAALDEPLARLFAEHHNPAVPYHNLPIFRLVLFACELRVHPPYSSGGGARLKRGGGVSRWVCAACSPALAHHVPAHCAALLQTLTDIATYLDESEGELEELLGRATAIFCMEPAATAALPVWSEWVSSASSRLVRASVSAAAVLTAFEYHAPLADTAIRAHLLHTDCGGWDEVCARLSPSPWRSAAPLVARARLHAAYATVRAHAHTDHMMQTALLALLAANIDFIESEVIVTLWILLACRIARTGEEEGAAAGRAVCVRWGEEGRRSLLKLVSLQADTTVPTPRHRMLCRLALCLLSPSENAARSYEAACSSVAGSMPDIVSWGKAPTHKHLPRLAIRLYPHAEKYFRDELKMAADD